MLESFLKLFGVHSHSKHFTMKEDHLLQLINTRLFFKTDTFLRDLVFLALLSHAPKSVVSRFMVKSLTHVKSPLQPCHECMVIELTDALQNNSEPLLMFLERTASNNCPDSNYFFTHPSYSTVLESIVQTLKEMPSTIVESISPLMTSRSNDSSLSLLSIFEFAHTPSSPYHPIVDQLETKLSWLDTATLAGAKVIHSSTQSMSNSYHAEDRFVGSKNTETYVPSLHNLRQILLEPKSLSLFDLAVLADTVHKHDPLYSTLKSHCFWFATIICDVVEKEYPCTTVHNKQYAPVSEDEICIPRNDYLPDLAGRSMGISLLEATTFVGCKRGVKCKWECFKSA
jgi:hypothetical protein